MATFSRTVEVDWSGPIMEGKGTAKAGTGAFSLPVSFPSRIGEPQGTTSPEELMAASHASCFAMALAHELQGRNAPPRSLDVSAAVGFDPKEGGGMEVSFSELTVMGDVPGLSAEDFQTAVSQASQGCPISQALKGNVEITAAGELS